MNVEYYPVPRGTCGTDWRIKDYKRRIYNKINQENREEKMRTEFIKYETVNKLVRMTMKQFHLKKEMEALILINNELTKKQMERYNNDRQIKQKQQYR